MVTSVRREIRQMPLKAAEGVAHLLHLRKALHHVKGHGVRDIGIGPPDAALPVMVHDVVVLGADHLQRQAAGILMIGQEVAPQVIGDGGDVGHHARGL